MMMPGAIEHFKLLLLMFNDDGNNNNNNANTNTRPEPPSVMSEQQIGILCPVKPGWV